VCGAGALLVFLSTVVIWQLCRRPYLGIGWFWYLGTLVPVIGIVQVGLQAMADRYTYLPHVGLFVALVWGSAEVVGRSPGRRAVAAVAGAAVLGGLTIVTWRQVPHWRDETSLYSRAVAAVPGNWFMIYNLGTALERQGRIEEAAARYEEVLRLRPSHADAHFNLGVILGNRGRSEDAISHYRAALHLRPDDADTHNNLAALLLAGGHAEEAVAHFREALRLRPDHPQALMGVRRALAQSPGRR
jgi:lipoprotein NlpI